MLFIRLALATAMLLVLPAIASTARADRRGVGGVHFAGLTVLHLTTPYRD